MYSNSSSRESKAIWNELAKWWDNNVQDGDLFHKTFVYPTILKFRKINRGNKILDIACGNGALSRRLATYKTEVVAIDFSEKLIHCAITRIANYKNIKYLIIDATDKDDLSQLITHGKFDTAICSMSLQDMWTIEPLIASLKYLLAKNGQFIFSIPHPYFNSHIATFSLSSGVLFGKTSSINVGDYMSHQAFRVQAKPNQPVSILSFHRPLSYIFNLLIKEGFTMSAFEEPVAEELVPEVKLPNESSWANFKKIPPAIIASWTVKESVGCHE